MPDFDSPISEQPTSDMAASGVPAKTPEIHRRRAAREGWYSAVYFKRPRVGSHALGTWGSGDDDLLHPGEHLNPDGVGRQSDSQDNSKRNHGVEGKEQQKEAHHSDSNRFLLCQFLAAWIFWMYSCSLGVCMQGGLAARSWICCSG